jgi:hypothetical protein
MKFMKESRTCPETSYPGSRRGVPNGGSDRRCSAPSRNLNPECVELMKDMPCEPRAEDDEKRKMQDEKFGEKKDFDDVEQGFEI